MLKITAAREGTYWNCTEGSVFGLVKESLPAYTTLSFLPVETETEKPLSPWISVTQ